LRRKFYHRIEPAGSAIPFDDAGRTRGLDDAQKTPAADFDRSCRAGLGWLSKHSGVAPGKIGAMGFCIGGHLAFRAALQPDVRATVCFYGTGIHNGSWVRTQMRVSLARRRRNSGELLMIFGSNDRTFRAKVAMQLNAAARHQCESPNQNSILLNMRSCVTKGLGSIQSRRILHLPT